MEVAVVQLSNVLLSLRRGLVNLSWVELDDPPVVYLLNFEAASSYPASHQKGMSGVSVGDSS